MNKIDIILWGLYCNSCGRCLSWTTSRRCIWST